MSPSTRGQTLAVPGVLRRLNERKIMEALIHLGPSSRAALNRHTHISPPTVSKTITALVEAGLVEELPQHGNSTGRPGRLYALATRQSQILGLAIDGESCWFCASGVDLQTHGGPSTRMPTPGTYDDLLNLVATQLEPLTQGPSRTLGLGVCIATAVAPTDGRVQACPTLTFLEGRTPAADLQARLGLPTSLSRLVDGLCLAETRSQPHAGAPTTCALLDLTAEPTVSLCAQGQLVPLSFGRGGGFGRIPLTPAGSSGRHLADCVSDDAFARRLDPRADHDTATLTRRLAQMASGDGFAAEDLAPLLDDLAAAAATVAHLFGPEVLVLRSRLLTAHPDGLQRVAAHVQGELGDTVTLRQAQMDPAQASLASFVYHLASALGPSVS